MQRWAFDLPGEALIALLGSLAAWVLRAAFLEVRRYLDRRRYPVAGRYGSSFEDRAGDTVTTIPAVVNLRQRGKKISGETTTLDHEARVWKMTGEIRPGGTLVGSYTAADPGDVGNGVFYLERKSSGRLEGFWAGYDSVNREVDAGRYTFWRLADLKIRAMTERDVSPVLALLGESLGKKYIQRSDLLGYLKDSAEAPRAAYVAVADGESGIAGALLCKILEPDMLAEHLPKGRGADVLSMIRSLNFHRIGLLQSVAVCAPQQGKGIGTSLIEKSLEWFRDNGATCILCIAWTDVAGCHIEGPVRRHGFTTCGDIAEFWKEDSIEKGYACPSCGNPCSCSARVMFKSRL